MADAKLNMSLDDLIKSSRTQGNKPKSKTQAIRGAAKARADTGSKRGGGAKSVGRGGGAAGTASGRGIKVGRGAKVTIPLNSKSQGVAKQRPARGGAAMAPKRLSGPVQVPRQAMQTQPARAQFRPQPLRPLPMRQQPMRQQPMHNMQEPVRGPPMMMRQQPMRAAPMHVPAMMQVPPSMGGRWQHDMYDHAQPRAVPARQPQQQQQQQPVRAVAVPAPVQQQAPVMSNSTKLFISNLDYSVSEDDVKELFSTVGALKDYGVHFDKSGRSLGTAHVEFTTRKEAMDAYRKYNEIQLDGKKMAIELVDAPAPPAGTFRTLSSGINVSRPNQARPQPASRGPPRAAMAARLGNGSYGGSLEDGDYMQE